VTVPASVVQVSADDYGKEILFTFNLKKELTGIGGKGFAVEDLGFGDCLAVQRAK